MPSGREQTVVDVARLRFAVVRFDELKGLRLVVVGAVFTLVFGGVLAAGETSIALADWHSVLLMLSTVPVIGAGLALVDRYYDRTFGRVHRHQDRPAWLSLAIPGLFALGMNVGRLLGVGSGLVFTGQGLFWLWLVLRDWPYRSHYLVGIAVASVSAGLTFSSATPSANWVFFQGFAVLGLGLVAVGPVDHLLLCRTLRESSALGRAARLSHLAAGNQHEPNP